MPTTSVQKQALAFHSGHRNLYWANVFVQDGNPHLRDNLHLTLGAKVEHNVYTGYEFLPSARIAWKPAPERLIWMPFARGARAVRGSIGTFYLFPTAPAPPFQIGGRTGFPDQRFQHLRARLPRATTSVISYS